MGIWKNNFTVMIIPRSSGELSQFTISAKLLWTISTCGICFVLLNLFLLADYFDRRVDQARLDQLSRENRMLSEQYTIMGESIADLQISYGQLVDKEEAIRTIFGLPVVDPEERMLGVGGPADPDINQVTPSTAKAISVMADVDQLLRLSRFERERYQEIFKALQGKKDLLDHSPSIMPTRGFISSDYGYRPDPFTGVNDFHPGIDISNHRGTPVYAAADGRVVFSGANGGLGKTVSINHGYGYETRYGHLSECKAKIGQTVKRGDLIGLMGSTGYVTGPHLHYEVAKDGKQVNPQMYVINR